MTGVLLFNKKPGISSFKSLYPIKKALKTPKVCHTGTLDSFAEGLLVLLIGRAVKLSSCFTGCDKHYRALLRFGEETDTLDPYGTIIARAPVPQQEQIKAALPLFTGEILQAPPGFSAIHINGKRAHELARAGIAFEIKKRPVSIYSLSLFSFNPPYAELLVHCSSGTYIRSLARDIALTLGSRAHLRTLTRTHIGNFSLENAISLPMENMENLENNDESNGKVIREAIMPLDRVLFAKLDIPCINIDMQTADSVSHGGDLELIKKGLPDFSSIVQNKEKNTLIALFGPESFAALIEQKAGLWKYRFVYSQTGGKNADY